MWKDGRNMEFRDGVIFIKLSPPAAALHPPAPAALRVRVRN